MQANLSHSISIWNNEESDGGFSMNFIFKVKISVFILLKEKRIL